jgi:hypothetical protein
VPVRLGEAADRPPRSYTLVRCNPANIEEGPGWEEQYWLGVILHLLFYSIELMLSLLLRCEVPCLDNRLRTVGVSKHLPSWKTIIQLRMPR